MNFGIYDLAGYDTRGRNEKLKEWNFNYEQVVQTEGWGIRDWIYDNIFNIQAFVTFKF